MPVLTESTRVTALTSLAYKRSLLSPGRVARLLRMTVNEVYDGMRSGWIPSVKINGAYFAHPRPLREWLSSMDGSYEGRPILLHCPRFTPRIVVVPPAAAVAA